MNALTVFLVIIGICLIVISYIFFEKTDEKINKNVVILNDYELDEEQMLKLQASIRDAVQEFSDELVDKTDNELMKLSNQRMMEINELGDQVIGDIDKNHKELVFLFDMLEDKSGSLKEYVSTSAARLFAMQQDVMRVVPEENRASAAQVLASEDTESKTKERLMEQVKEAETVQPVTEDMAGSDEIQKRNEEILKQFKFGKSILDIAKEMDMGVGEVQLVVGLYKGE